MLRKLALVALVVVLAGCDQMRQYQESQGNADAPIVRTEMQGWVVMSSPDHFSNIAFRCFGPNGLYNLKTSEKDSARNLVVISPDPQCPK